MQKLFDEKERTNLNYAKNQHNTYDFYNDTAKDEFVEVRDRLEEWFSRYPENDKKQLKRDIQSQFEPAFFELFIHELFFQQGFTLTVHPKIPNSSKNPDFLAKREDVEIYLEAKNIYDNPYETSIASKLNAIIDKLNEVKSDFYGICIENISFLSNKQAKLGKIKSFFQRKINEHSEDLKTKDTEYHEHREMQIYQDSDIRIVFAILKFDCKLTRIVVCEPMISFIGGCDDVIKKGIKEKAYHYGLLNKPFIICINSLSYKFTRTEDVYKALFGSRRNVSFEDLNSLNQDFKTSNDGIFDINSNVSCKNVSGVFITTVNPHNLQVADHWFVKHPYTINDFELNKLDLSYIQVSDDRIQLTKKLSIGEILK